MLSTVGVRNIESIDVCRGGLYICICVSVYAGKLVKSVAKLSVDDPGAPVGDWVRTFGGA